MEEVDSIILHFLRQLNVKVDDNVKNICELSVETIIESVSKCLCTINPAAKLPRSLPQGVSHRIEVAAQMASNCKDLGYKGEVGYQTFLYYNEAELRQVFMFLIEKLPNESKQTTVSFDATSKSVLMHNISNKIREELETVWIPPCCVAHHKSTIGDFINEGSVQNTGTGYVLSEEDIVQRLLKLKTAKEDTAGSQTNIYERDNTDQLVIKNIQDEKPFTKTIDKSSKELKEIAIGLKHKVNIYEAQKNSMDVEYSQALKKYERVKADLNNVKETLKSIGITDIDSNIEDSNVLEKLHSKINKLHKSNEELTSKILSLKAEIQKAKNRKSLCNSERIKCKNIILDLKNTAKALNEEYEEKEELKKQIIKNYVKLKGGNKRSIYTKRILEIISNVDKQNVEIKKILEDTKELQKEINILEGQLDRCFSIADETLFKDAKRDDQAKKAYKLLALLHSECNSITSLVNDTGTLAREIVDLEDNIKTESAKKTEDTLKKVLYDLNKIQEELS